MSHLFLQLKQLMIVGIDCYHDITAGKRSIGALVASLNQSMSRLVYITETCTGVLAPFLSVLYLWSAVWIRLCTGLLYSICFGDLPVFHLVQLINCDISNFFVKVVLKVCAAAQRTGNHGRTEDGSKWQVAFCNFTNIYFILIHTLILLTTLA